MTDQLVIREKYSKYWPLIAGISLALSLILFITYHFVDNILWTGYLRLAAFIFFAIALLSYFKVKDGRVKITVRIDDPHVESLYKVKEQIISRHEIPLSDINELKVDQLPNKSLYNDFVRSDKCVRFRRKDESAWYYFNEIETRVIPLSKKNAEKLFNFLKRHSDA